MTLRFSFQFVHLGYSIFALFPSFSVFVFYFTYMRNITHITASRQ